MTGCYYGRMLFWQAFAFHIDGFLHWGHNFWHRTGQDASGWPGISRYADSGLRTGHPEFLGRVIPGWNFVDGIADTDDSNGNGRSSYKHTDTTAI